MDDFLYATTIQTNEIDKWNKNISNEAYDWSIR